MTQAILFSDKIWARIRKNPEKQHFIHQFDLSHGVTETLTQSRTSSKAKDYYIDVYEHPTLQVHSAGQAGQACRWFFKQKERDYYNCGPLYVRSAIRAQTKVPLRQIMVIERKFLKARLRNTIQVLPMCLIDEIVSIL